MRNDRQMETLAIAAHGGAVVLHLLGLVYNVRRGNRFDSVCHALAVVYDGWAVAVHMRAYRETE
jgi:hypothetical protein